MKKRDYISVLMRFILYSVYQLNQRGDFGLSLTHLGEAGTKENTDRPGNRAGECQRRRPLER